MLTVIITKALLRNKFLSDSNNGFEIDSIKKFYTSRWAFTAVWTQALKYRCLQGNEGSVDATSVAEEIRELHETLRANCVSKFSQRKPDWLLESYKSGCYRMKVHIEVAWLECARVSFQVQVPIFHGPTGKCSQCRCWWIKKLLQSLNATIASVLYCYNYSSSTVESLDFVLHLFLSHYCYNGSGTLTFFGKSSVATFLLFKP